jgi:hypothetical protein
MAEKLNKCLKSNCHTEIKHFNRDYEKYKQNLYKISEDALNGIISFSEAQKRIKSSTMKMFRLRDRLPLGKCQVQHCYKETYDLINNFLKIYKNQLMQRIVFANKYLNMVRKGMAYKKLLKI